MLPCFRCTEYLLSVLSPSALSFPFCLLPLFQGIWKKFHLMEVYCNYIVISGLVVSSVSAQEKKKVCFFLECFFVMFTFAMHVLVNECNHYSKVKCSYFM